MVSFTAKFIPTAVSHGCESLGESLEDYGAINQSAIPQVLTRKKKRTVAVLLLKRRRFASLTAVALPPTTPVDSRYSRAT